MDFETYLRLAAMAGGVSGIAGLAWSFFTKDGPFNDLGAVARFAASALSIAPAAGVIGAMAASVVYGAIRLGYYAVTGT